MKQQPPQRRKEEGECARACVCLLVLTEGEVFSVGVKAGGRVHLMSGAVSSMEREVERGVRITMS